MRVVVCVETFSQLTLSRLTLAHTVRPLFRRARDGLARSCPHTSRDEGSLKKKCRSISFHDQNVCYFKLQSQTRFRRTMQNLLFTTTNVKMASNIKDCTLSSHHTIRTVLACPSIFIFTTPKSFACFVGWSCVVTLTSFPRKNSSRCLTTSRSSLCFFRDVPHGARPT